MWDMILDNFMMTCKIIIMVTILLIIIEYLELKYTRKIRDKLSGRPINQYVIASLLGATHVCLDAFLIVSLYIHGMVSFGARDLNIIQL